MGPKTSEMSVDLRKLIVRLYCEGKSMREISQIVKKSKSTVQYIIEHYGKCGTVINSPRSGRPKVVNPTQEREILREIKTNPIQSATEINKKLTISSNLQCSTETVRNILRKNNFNARTVRKKPFISQVNKKKRMDYAKKHLNKGEEFWNQIIFSDESKFNIHGSDSRQKVWRNPNTELQVQNLKGTVKHGGGNVMVWGCMSAGGVGNLVFIESTMNSSAYLDILKNNLKKSAETMGLADNFTFMHDNDPKHNSYLVREWLLYNVKHKLDHPPQSPDLNPIENLWELLDRKIRVRPIKDKNELKSRLLEEWGKISPDMTANLVNSMNRRLLAVKKAKGMPTKDRKSVV